MRTTDPKRELPFILWSSALRQTARMRVLIVEDEVGMANVIRRSLSREGIATDVARSPE